MKKKAAPDRTSPRSGTVPLSDCELYYEEYGSGEPLLLLHGFGGSTRTWYPFLPELSEHFRLIVVDLRGHGRSTNPSNVFTHRQAADDVYRLLDAIDIDSFSAIGISSGGMTLLHMATMQPGRITSMVLVSATTHFPDQARAIMRDTSFERMPRYAQEMYRDGASRGDEQVRQLIAQFKAFHTDTDDMAFTAASLSAIRTRTLIVHGDRDRFFPVEIAVDMYRGIPDSSLWIVPDGDHVPVYDPALPFIPTAVRFLSMGR